MALNVSEIVGTTFSGADKVENSCAFPALIRTLESHSVRRSCFGNVFGCKRHFDCSLAMNQSLYQAMFGAGVTINVLIMRSTTRVFFLRF
jgi:hypothetical protein